MKKKVVLNKNKIATGIAILFHATGLTGILWVDKISFASLTSLNMLVTLLLILWTQDRKNAGFFLFAALCFVVGFSAEAAGVNTGLLFGNYRYGDTLGIKLRGVPLLIGLNWFIIIYCCGITMHMLQQKIRSKIRTEDSNAYAWWSKASVVIDGALLAVFFDWVMEPVAVSLGFWQWTENGVIPMLNYISWFALSILLLIIFLRLRFSKTNVFAVNLLLIQCMFFLILRTVLPS